MAKRIEDGEYRPTHEEITRRAHAIYEASGRLPGHDLDNWLQAETELQTAGKRSGSARLENRETTTPARPPARAVNEVGSRTGS
jgi:hypothetical protein